MKRSQLIRVALSEHVIAIAMLMDAEITRIDDVREEGKDLCDMPVLRPMGQGGRNELEKRRVPPKASGPGRV